MLPLSDWQVSDASWFHVRQVVRKHLFLQLFVAFVLDFEDYMAMDIEVGLEMHNQIVWYLGFHALVMEWYYARN